MNAIQLKEYISGGAIDNLLKESCADDPESVIKTCIEAIDSFAELYGGEGELHLFSVGGRTEVSGNHTDHNNGCVLAAAVNLQVIAVAAARDDGVIRIKSKGFPEDTVAPKDIESPDEKDFFTSRAIIAGTQRAFLNNGFKVGGFDAYTVSTVLKGSGLSSSAAFEVMVGNILNTLYNGGAVPNPKIAEMAQYAENVYFGKPCGLMDQTACAVGGFIYIDFKNPDSPEIKKLDFDLEAAGYALCIVNTGGNHADLNEDYASVPAEMKGAAALLGHSVLRECSQEEILAGAGLIREKLGDRALLRSLHFTAENRRVAAQAKALEAGDIDTFLQYVSQSGSSSFKYLQNVYTPKNVREQGLSLALCLTEEFLRERKGACRVHGGGFAGTVQVFLPKEDATVYKKYIEGFFGAGSCHRLSVRPAGAVCLV